MGTGSAQLSCVPKRRFDIHTVLRRISEAVAEHADAAMFELAERGFQTVFQQLVACIISIRTRDEVSLPLAIRLLERAPTPDAMATLSVRQIDALIRASSFHEGKAAPIREIARRTVDEFSGELPCDFEVLTSFRDVGPKCANLTMGVACGAERISVDIHVHRVTNRWGYVATTSPVLLFLPRRTSSTPLRSADFSRGEIRPWKRSWRSHSGSVAKASEPLRINGRATHHAALGIGPLTYDRSRDEP
jgi:endonuclease III